MVTQKKILKYDLNKYKYVKDLPNQINHNYCVYKSIKAVFNGNSKFDDPYFKTNAVLELLCDCDSIELLTTTINNLFPDFDIKKILVDFESIYKIDDYILYPITDRQRNRVFSIYCSTVIKFELFKEIINTDFYFKLGDKEVIVAKANINHRLIVKSLDWTIKKFKTDKLQFNKFIAELDKFDFENETETFERIIKHLERQRDAVSNDNRFPDIFKDTLSYLIFEKYIKNHLLNPYNDVSFIYYKLMEEKRLLKITHQDFNVFLLKNKFIKEQDFTTILNKKSFNTKSSSDERLNNYHNILKELEENI